MPIWRDRGFGMADRNLLRDSLIIAAIMIPFALAAAGLALSVLTGATPSDQVAGRIALAVVLFLVVMGLGFVLWRREAEQSRA
jgi:hypothetical protein